jgi:hypothetical protein
LGLESRSVPDSLTRSDQGENVPEFPGRIRLMEDPLDVKADIEIADGCLALIVSNREVGEWRLDQVGIEIASEGFLMKVDGEAFVFATPRTQEFAEAVGVGAGQRRKTRSEARPSRASRRAARRAAKPVATPKIRKLATSSVKAWWSHVDWDDPRLRLSVGAVAVGLFMAIVARPLLAGLLLVGGMGAGVLSGAAIVDPLLASRLPTGWTNFRLVLAALMSLMVGMLLIAF